MQVYMATLESYNQIFENLPDNYIKYGLVSFYYMGDNDEKFRTILSKCENVLVDSGAHSFQHGLGEEIDFLEFTKKYANFIKKWTKNKKVVGFFEMDIDNVEGYEKVLEYRKILEEISDKIIPVWHNNRGVEEFHNMCKQYTGKRISITGFKNNDIIDSQYNLFLNTAHHYGCNVHILGMTRYSFMKSLNLHENDSSDSSTWRKRAVFGQPGGITPDFIIQRFYSLMGLKVSGNHYLKINFIVDRNFQRSL